MSATKKQLVKQLRTAQRMLNRIAGSDAVGARITARIYADRFKRSLTKLGLLIVIGMMAGGIDAVPLPPVPSPAHSVKRYHSTPIRKGAEALRTHRVAFSVPLWTLTWTPNYTVTNEVTVIEQSTNLLYWTRVFTGATNQTQLPGAGPVTFWRAGNMKLQ